MDPSTGYVLNEHNTAGLEAYGINSPVIVGGQLYLGAIGGRITAVPVEYVTTTPGVPEAPLPTPPPWVQIPKLPLFYDAAAFPSAVEAAAYPERWLAYAGGPKHNAVAEGPDVGLEWTTPLFQARPLNALPLDVNILGFKQATVLTAEAFGAGMGVTPVGGMIFVGNGRYTMHALNAGTGETIWRTRFIDFLPGQPLSTGTTVIETMGNSFMGFGEVAALAKGETVSMGGNWQAVQGFDPVTGVNKWTVYSRHAIAMTPLFDEGNLYWVDGAGVMRAVDAESGLPEQPFLNGSGLPALEPLPGANVRNSANIFKTCHERIMTVGTFLAYYGVSLDSGQVLWSANPLGDALSPSGYAGATPAIDPRRGLLVSTALQAANPDTGDQLITAFALDARSGGTAWRQDWGRAGPEAWGIFVDAVRTATAPA